MKWFFQCCFAISLLILHPINCENLLKFKDIEAWYNNVRNPRFDCRTKNGQNSIEKGQNNIPLEFIDCNAKGARVDYLIKPGEMTFLSKGPLFGFATILLAKRTENGPFNHGLKFGKCLRISQPGLIQIAGNFEDDKLEGPITMEFENSTIAVGYAKSGQLVGILRTWKQSNILEHVYNTDSGETIIKRDFFGFYRIRTDQKNRVLLTKDFNDIKNCIEIDANLMVDCFNLSDPDLAKVVVQAEKCSISVDFTNFLTISGNNKKRFRYSLRHDLARFEDEGTEEGNLPCEGDYIRSSMDSWIQEASNPGLLWFELGPEGPLDIENPTLNITLNGYKHRPNFPSTVNVRIETDSGQILWRGLMKNGVISGKVQPEIAPLPVWRSRLKIVLGDRLSEHNLSATASVPDLSVINVEDDNGHYVKTFLKNGKLHGIVQQFGIKSNDPEGHCSEVLHVGLGFVGFYNEGQLVGPAWRGLVGGSWIYGFPDDQGRFSTDGTSDDLGKIAYIYPDLETAMVGTFNDGIMVEGREADITSWKCTENGIRALEFSQPKGPKFHYEPPTQNTLGDQPLLRDPLDKKYVILKNSTRFPLAGEATYAARDVPKDTVFALYVGNLHRYANSNEDEILRNKDRDTMIANDWDIQDQRSVDLWKYRYKMGVCGITVDLPPEYGSTEVFNSTIGHKISHAFDPTCTFTTIDTPRFGILPALKTREAVKKGEEFYLDYGYKFNEQTPKWFRDAFRDFARENPKRVNPRELDSLDALETKIARQSAEFEKKKKSKKKL